MATYRVLVTGSRTWTDQDTIIQAFNWVNKTNQDPTWPVVLVHGGARGLDREAAALAHGEYGWRVEEHPAAWNTHDPRHPTHPCPAWHEGMDVCKMAGHRRNSDMVRLRADVCLAFIKDGSSGATGCADLAEKAGIPTRRFTE